MMRASDPALAPDREEVEAIARVLAAERDARIAVADCERRAEALVAAARACDRRVAERAAARVAAIRASMGERRAEAIERIERDADDPQTAEDRAAEARISAAVARLAEELATGDRP
jgi:hypothetical protein